MGVFAIGVEYALDASVERHHHPDAREHRWPAEVGDQDQGFHSRLPLRGGVHVLRKPDDVVASV